MASNHGINIIDIKLSETGSELITLAEAKTATKVTGTDFDSELTALIKKARRWSENFCLISIIDKTITMIAEFHEEWELPYGPVKQILEVKQKIGHEGSGPSTYQTVDVWETDGEDFKTFNPLGGAGCCGTNTPVGQFSLRSGPTTRLRIVYTTGYGTIPDDMKEGVLDILVYMFEHRGEENTEPPVEAIDKLIPYKRMLWL